MRILELYYELLGRMVCLEKPHAASATQEDGFA
jgi:hypothetical protein